MIKISVTFASALSSYCTPPPRLSFSKLLAPAFFGLTFQKIVIETFSPTPSWDHLGLLTQTCPPFRGGFPPKILFKLDDPSPGEWGGGGSA